MASPTRFPKGLSTFAPRHILSSFPIATAPSQITLQEDFIPYRAGDNTVTTAVGGTITAYGQIGSGVRLNTSASATDTIFLQRLGAGFQFLRGNQGWFNARVAIPRTVLGANDTNQYFGWGDGATFALSNNFIGFFKPTGGTSISFIIRKAGVTTTFNNIGDYALPSGLFGDTNSVNATLSATIAGGAFTAASVATPGAGYAVSPLCLSTATAAGTVGSSPVIAGLGATTYSASNPSVPIQSTGLPYSSVYAPYVANPGSGFTNAGPLTTLLEVVPYLDLSFWFDGEGRIAAGINGRQVLGVGIGGVGGIAAGGTVNVATSATGASFFSTTQLTAAVAPVQPVAGSVYNLLPLVPMNVLIGFTNTTAAIRTLYLSEYSSGIEFN